MKTYDEIYQAHHRGDDIAEFTATWPNGNEPDGSTIVVISLYGSDGDGYILRCDDNDSGGSPREAGETVYATRDAAVTAAKNYASGITCDFCGKKAKVIHACEGCDARACQECVETDAWSPVIGLCKECNPDATDDSDIGGAR